jgi:hypothetical protein
MASRGDSKLLPSFAHMMYAFQDFEATRSSHYQNSNGC